MGGLALKATILALSGGAASLSPPSLLQSTPCLERTPRLQETQDPSDF